MPKTVAFNLTDLVVDLPPYKVSPDRWTLHQNIEVNEGFPRRARGFGRVFGSTLFLPRFLLNGQRFGVSEFIYGGDTGLAFTDGTAHFDITGTLVYNSLGATSPWTGGMINNIAALSNKTGPAMFWETGTAAALILPDWPTTRRAGSLRVYREFLVALDITENGVRDSDLIRWSDAAPQNDVPQSWTAGAQSLAGSASAAFTPGDLVDGLTLRDQFMIYKAHAMYTMSLIAGRLVMATRPVFSTLGMLTRNCAVEWRGQHIVLTDGDVVIHNGIEARSLIDRRIRKAIFSNIDTVNFENSYVVIDKELQEVWICVPREGELFPRVALVWSIADDAWGFRELGVNSWPHGVEGKLNTAIEEPTWASRTTLWNTDSSQWSTTGISPVSDSLVFADAGNLLQAMGQRDDFDGITPTAILQRIGLDMGVPTNFKYVTRIWPKLEGVNGAVVRTRIGGQENVNSPVIWEPYQDYVIGTTDALDFDASGRFISVEFRSETDATWRSPAFDLEVNLQGQF